MIPQSIHDFVKKVVEGKHPHQSEPIVDRQANVLTIIETLVSGKDSSGSGVVTKREVKGVSTKDSGKDKTLIKFGVSDGENAVQCVAHNCNDKYLMGSYPLLFWKRLIRLFGNHLRKANLSKLRVATPISSPTGYSLLMRLIGKPTFTKPKSMIRWFKPSWIYATKKVSHPLTL